MFIITIIFRGQNVSIFGIQQKANANARFQSQESKRTTTEKKLTLKWNQITREQQMRNYREKYSHKTLKIA